LIEANYALATSQDHHSIGNEKMQKNKPNTVPNSTTNPLTLNAFRNSAN